LAPEKLDFRLISERHERRRVASQMSALYAKLVTHEDPLHLHKTIGAICLANFAAQMALYALHAPCLTLYTLVPHMLLPLTSFIFKVLPRRPIENRMSMFIWSELRLHAVIFSLRSCLVIIFPAFAVPIVALTLISADIATLYRGTPGVSTVRGKNTERHSQSWTKATSAAFFSISQIGATIICGGLFQPSVSPILAFLTLPPIQTSAFGMTLIRKNLITKTTWTQVYFAELLLTYAYWFSVYGNMHVILYAVPIYILRRQRISKYVLWFAYAVCHLYGVPLLRSSDTVSGSHTP
jgi:hypothetical protein